ncbi:Acyl-coenzyme A thioesterase PaaI, contains HGG motif [Micromonospora krabiensis]|uniref:Acyl-coenzyme A thioesterase PaaI, contains HGG motif n=2 Tax=Micromonospora krabiensis TaxID=307121 RepID=A0A1C3N751_9ACTN|nr:Acyl-coenzyme A thioesterase PaaI, contains HGG motif [Micromonospora krabiensis]
MLEAVPFARTLGFEFVEIAPEAEGGVRAVVRLPDSPATHNHVGGPHAGAMFTLGETASGAVVLAAFGHLLDRAVPLAVRADIAYHKLALGAVRATARLGRTPAEVAAELAAGRRPEFPVEVEISTDDGTPTSAMTVIWTLRPQ